MYAKDNKRKNASCFDLKEKKIAPLQERAGRELQKVHWIGEKLSRRLRQIYKDIHACI